MASQGPELSPTAASLDGQLQDLFRALSTGFQKLDKVKDANRQSKQLEELTAKMREAKRLIKDFDREIKDEESRNSPEVNKQLNEKKQALIKELNSYVALRKTYTSALGGGRNELLDGGKGEPLIDDGVKLASSESSCLSLHVVQDTINIGEQTALTLKAQTEQMGRIVNELDTIQFSIKKASQLVKEIGRQLATDKCIMFFLFLIVCGVIAIIIVKVVNPKNKNIVDIPGLAPPASTTTNRRLLLALLES
ncbi:hypothetical protein AXG93_2752s1620 [Marchantia polymorpha subsp. ruderalis]|uniref:t-SNARE coiled-coil homology domain-containing protein n=1 Tax=Marchantia polymorpha subsp. ruderalis TaxID=1480154 RepID=A0A176VTR7_MARPO|nr:hypothetical protein AXG93_2752s1620 [Marchantia polymorpha subsp. ruderalis]